MTQVAFEVNVNTWTNDENLGDRGDDVECQSRTPAHNPYRGNETHDKQYSRVYFDQNIPVDSIRRRIKFISSCYQYIVFAGRY